MYRHSLVSALAAAVTLLPGANALVNPLRRDITPQTTFLYHNCDTAQTKTLFNSYSDALELAKASLESGWVSYYIDWESEAALDYFGPKSQSSAYAAFVVDTFYRATQTYAGNPSDWWNDRYVDVYCGGNSCDPTTPAYNAYRKEHGGKYPELHYCPAFFSQLKDHDTLVKEIKADKTGRMKLNLRNLRSQASTVLHEWLHIKNAPAEVCVGGCIDTSQKVGGDSVLSYKAGRAKLLAARSSALASKNNDNYVYFAMAKWMQKNLGAYPEFPTMWNPNYNRKTNEDFEKVQPGAPDAIKPFELEDAQPASELATSSQVVDAPIYGSNQYPEWFRPKLDLSATSSGKLPDIKAPPIKAPVVGPTSGINKLICETSQGSPLIEDCVHAFGSLYEFPTLGATHGHKGKTWWAGYVHSCAVAIYYEADWTDSCNATLADVQVHASKILNNCGNGGIGKVGGHIPFGNTHCPAQIEIIHTAGQPPQGN